MVKRQLVCVLAMAGVLVASASIARGEETPVAPAMTAPVFGEPSTVTLPEAGTRGWHVEWLQDQETPPASPFTALKLTAPIAATQEQAAPAKRPVAYDYSDAYMTRAKIHRYASWATLPIFVANYYAGDQLYDGDFTEGQKSFHSSMVNASIVLFGLNSVTGVWNLWEGRKDPNHRTRRMVHGIMMLAADVGFVATGATAPDFEEGKGEDRSTHRTLAITSMGIATASYLFMLFAR